LQSFEVIHASWIQGCCRGWRILSIVAQLWQSNISSSFCLAVQVSMSHWIQMSDMLLWCLVQEWWSAETSTWLIWDPD
jgi:hypothetical protein